MNVTDVATCPTTARGTAIAISVYVQFSSGIAQGEMPPLFIIGASDKSVMAFL
jgi:hypothetical protein